LHLAGRNSFGGSRRRPSPPAARKFTRRPRRASGTASYVIARCGTACSHIAGIGRRAFRHPGLHARRTRQLAPAAHRPPQMERRPLGIPIAGSDVLGRAVACGISCRDIGRRERRTQTTGG